MWKCALDALINISRSPSQWCNCGCRCTTSATRVTYWSPAGEFFHNPLRDWHTWEIVYLLLTVRQLLPTISREQGDRVPWRVGKNMDCLVHTNKVHYLHKLLITCATFCGVEMSFHRVGGLSRSSRTFSQLWVCAVLQMKIFEEIVVCNLSLRRFVESCMLWELRARSAYLYEYAIQ